MAIPTYPDRNNYTDYVDGVSSGTVIDNSAYQTQQKRAEDFYLFENSHLYKSYGWLVAPTVIKPSTRRLTFQRVTANPSRYVSDLGYWEIPADLSIDFNTLTGGTDVNRTDYLYLELFRYKTGSGAYPNFVKNAFGGKVGYRLNIYQGNSSPTTSTTPDKTTSVKDTATEEGHVIFPLASVLRYQTVSVAEADLAGLADISIPAVANLPKIQKIRCVEGVESPDIKSLLYGNSYSNVYGWTALPASSAFPLTSSVLGSGTSTISNGILTLYDPDVSSCASHYRAETINLDDIVVVEHTCKINSSGVARDNLIMGLIESIPTPTNYKCVGIVADLTTVAERFTGNVLAALDTTVYHTYRLVKIGQAGVYFFVDGKLAYSWDDMSVFGTVNSSFNPNVRNIAFGNGFYGIGSGNGGMDSKTFKYSILREDINAIVGNSVELHDGTNNLLVSGKTIENKSTNGNIDQKTNGTGFVNATNTTGFGVTGAQKVASDFVQNDTAVGVSVKLQDGSEAIRLTNRTGTNSVKGTVVSLDGSNDNSFVACGVNAINAIGTVLEDAVANGSACWVAVGASFQALLKNTTASTRGQYAMVSDTAGRIISTATAPTTIAEAQKYLGLIAESKSSGTNVLCRVVKKGLGG